MTKRSEIWDTSDEDLQRLIDGSASLKDLCNKFNINAHNGSIRTLYRRLKEFDFDFSKMQINRSYLQVKRSQDNIEFCEHSKTTRSVIRRLVLRNSMIEYKCTKCSNAGVWQDEKLSLHLEHINGINDDNRIENLCFLCPNCHSQTASYAGRNKKYFTFEKKIKVKKERNKKFDPPKEELEQLINSNISMVKIGEQYHVSDNAVRKRCEILGIDYKKRTRHK